MLGKLARREWNVVEHSNNTRPVHHLLFQDLTPPDAPYFAGHYRGEDFSGLLNYFVEIRSDPLVGTHPRLVFQKMDFLGQSIRAAIGALDGVIARGERRFTEDFALKIAKVSAWIFVTFLGIHPYANGNGHAARFIVRLVAWHYGYWAGAWTIEPRPGLPGDGTDYSSAIYLYRRGNTEILERAFLLMLLDGAGST
ncbi:MAG: Fic family protein [Deltaproteobacteria bacterium]|nr:Fic family protein [Deltaproteobacteria bacterium]